MDASVTKPDNAHTHMPTGCMQRSMAQQIAPSCATSSQPSECVQVGNVPAVPINYANDLDVAPDGTVYFTDCSHMAPAYSKALQAYDTLAACLLTLAQVRH